MDLVLPVVKFVRTDTMVLVPGNGILPRRREPKFQDRSNTVVSINLERVKSSLKVNKILGVDETEVINVIEVNSSSVPDHLLPKPEGLQPGDKVVVLQIDNSRVWFDKTSLASFVARLQKIVHRL